MGATRPTTTTAPRTPIRRALAAAAGLAAAASLLGVTSACAGGPNLARVITVREGERTRVRLVQFDNRRVMTLQNASSGSAHEVYENGADPLVKVLPDADMQRLLDVFAEAELFQTATTSAPAEAKNALIVDHGGSRFVFHLRGMPQGALERYLEAKAYFVTVYSNAQAFHSAKINRMDLENEKHRARYDAIQSRRKLQNASRNNDGRGRKQ